MEAVKLCFISQAVRVTMTWLVFDCCSQNVYLASLSLISLVPTFLDLFAIYGTAAKTYLG